ncbi:cbb3-type cytochrome oxidase subunit 3 [Vreelandella sulfidaeris]|uniref:cbb3-type cytochrome oxidase subunit 3 n=1 Tax=Vreelandella sulfidaeris TaxID=115553 RepID=UPI0035ED1E92|tara:strand:- start:11061 stop:11285 length:225 start_codon:yes stop_codon:yes gene_type:complete
MDTGTFRGLITLILMVAFIGIALWAYSKRRKPDFDEAAHLPFADDDELPPSDKQASQQRDSEANARHDRGENKL